MRSNTTVYALKSARAYSKVWSKGGRIRGYATIAECDNYDVVIIGGGPAGLAFASALGESNTCLNIP